MGVDKIGVWVATIEIRRRLAVLCCPGQTQLFLKDVLAIRTSDTGQTVEEDLEVGVVGEELLDQGEVEDILEHLSVVGSAVDDLDLEVSVGVCANLREIDIGDICDLVGLESLRGLVDLVGDALGRGATVGQVVLDTEIFVGTCSTRISSDT